MRVYVAHNMSAASWINQEIRPALENLGIQITSRWLDGHQEHDREAYAKEDLADIVKADLLLYFAAPYKERSGTGKHIELGYALGLNKQVAIIGLESELTSVFHWLDTSYGVRRYEIFPDLLSELRMAAIFKRL